MASGTRAAVVRIDVRPARVRRSPDRRRQPRHRPRRPDHGDRPGQLDLEPRRIDTGLVHHLDGALDQLGLLELARGHIDADVQVEPGIAPAAQLGARGAQDPLAEQHDEPGLLRERDAARGLDQAQFRVTPADRRFGAAHPVSREIDLRLIVQHQFTPLRGAPQPSFERHSLADFAIDPRAKKAIVASAFGLGGVQRGAGILEQVFGAGGVLRVEAHADAHRDMPFAIAGAERPSQVRENALGNLASESRSLDRRQQHEKQIAGHPRDGVDVAGCLSQSLRHLPQQRIAGGVSARFVDHAEPVDVDRHHSDMLVVAVRSCHRLADSIEHGRAVRQSGEGIVRCQVAGVIGGAPGLAHIARLEYHPAHARVCGQVLSGDFEPGPGAVRPPHTVLRGETALVAGDQRAKRRPRFAGGAGVDGLETIAPDQVAGGIPQHPGRGRGFEPGHAIRIVDGDLLRFEAPKRRCYSPRISRRRR